MTTKFYKNNFQGFAFSLITFLVTPQEQPSLPLSPLPPPPPPLVKNFDRSFMNENLCKIKHIDFSRSKIKALVNIYIQNIIV